MLAEVWNFHPPLHSERYLLVREAELLGFEYHLWRHGALVLVTEGMCKEDIQSEWRTISLTWL